MLLRRRPRRDHSSPVKRITGQGWLPVGSLARVNPLEGFEVSVGAVTDTGPRPVNADRFFTAQSPVDGAWVIAVADGLGAHPRAPDAAAAAVEGLPARIESLDAMADAFVAASERVVAVAQPFDDYLAERRAECGSDEEYERRLANFSRFESGFYNHGAGSSLCTLCVAAWTPAGGLLVASMGDTLAFEVHWRPDGSPHRRLIADPHRDPPAARYVSSYLGGGPADSLIRRDSPGDYNPDFAAVEVELPADPAAAMAIIVASDGAWEPLWRIIHAAWDAATDDERRTYSWQPVVLADGWTVDLAGPAAPADAVAGRILDAARRLGLEDNATVAAAVLSPPPVPPAPDRSATATEVPRYGDPRLGPRIARCSWRSSRATNSSLSSTRPARPFTAETQLRSATRDWGPRTARRSWRSSRATSSSMSSTRPATPFTAETQLRRASSRRPPPLERRLAGLRPGATAQAGTGED